MSDLSELVVKLTFDHGDAKSQIKQFAQAISGVETNFRAAAAEAGGFSTATDKAKNHAAMLTQQLELQKRATEQLKGMMGDAQGRLTDATRAYQDQAKKVDELRARNASLKTEVSGLEKAMRESKAATGDNTDEYIGLSLKLDETNKALAENEKALKSQELQLKKNDTQVARAEKGLTSATQEYDKARLSQANMSKELDDLNKKIQKHVQWLEEAGKKLKTYGDKTRETGQAQSRIGQGLTAGVTAPVLAAGGASVGAAIGWESDFAGVQKTVNGTAEELQRINGELLTMSTNIPTTANDLAGIAANAGQMGIATPNVTGFTRTIADLKETTNLTAEQGAQDFAKFANITKMPQTAFSNMGSAVVELGNNLATTESDTVAMAMNLAAAGSQAKMSQAQILGISAALSSLGLEAQAGGTAFSKTITEMQVAVETGSKDLNDYAKIAGMSSAQFAEAFRTDAAGALSQFIAGLSSGSQSAVVMLDKMGVTETRTRDALLRASGAGDLLKNSIQLSTDAWRTNVALTNEANVRYQTAQSKITMAGNAAKAAAISVGGPFLDAVKEGAESVTDFANRFAELDEATKKQILTFAGLAAAAGPTILMIGKGNEAVAAVATGLGKFSTATAAAGGGVKGFVSALGGALGPVGVIALGAAVLVGAAAWYDYASGAKAAREATEAMNETAKQWQDTQASTIFDTGNDPFQRFGLDKSQFGGGADASKDWLDRLNKTWTDGKVETKQIIADYVDEFTAGTDKVREAIEARKQTQEKYGVTGDKTTEDDLKKLKVYDKEVEALLKKRKNGTLTEEDQQRLTQIIRERMEIQLMYTTGAGGGYESLSQAVEAEKARLKQDGDKGGETAALYGDALTGAAQGYQTQVDAINQSYRDQYADIMAITDEKEREAALTQLNKEHTEALTKAQEEYNKVVGKYAPEAFETPEVKEAADQMQQLQDKIADFEKGKIDATELKAFTDTLDEGKLASYVALLQQMKQSDLGDFKFGEADGKPITPESLLGGYKTVADYLKANAGTLTGLGEMLGAAGDEANRVLVDLGLTPEGQTLKDWIDGHKEFTVTGTLTAVTGNGETFTVTDATINADGTLTGVDGNGNTFTATNCTVNADGILTGVTGDGQTFTVTDVTVNASAILTGVTGDGQTFTVTNATINADGTLTGVDGEGKTFTATNCTVDAEGTLTGVDGEGKTFTVTNVTVNADGTLNSVSGKGKVFTVTDVTVNADGTLTGVTGDGKTFTASNYTANADGTLTGVDGEGNVFTVTGATVTVPATLSGVTGDGQAFTVTDATVEADGTLTGVTGDGKTFTATNYTVNADGTLTGVDGEGKSFTVTNAIITAEATLSGVTGGGQTFEVTDAVVKVTATPTPYEPGTQKSVDFAQSKMEQKPTNWASGIVNSTAGDITPITNIINEIDRLQTKIDEMKAAGNFWDENGIGLAEYEAELAANLEMLGPLLKNLNADDLSRIAISIKTLMDALASDTLTPEQTAQVQEQLTSLLDLIKAADQYLGVGNDVSAGIASGMTGYGWTGDATTVASSIETALRAALESQSPAKKLVPVGSDAAAGIGQGLAAYSFAADAAKAAGGVGSAMELAMQLAKIGEDQGKDLMNGVIKGLGDKKDDAIKKAKEIADAIKEVIRKAWDINSPSKEGEWLGGMLIEGVGQGMDRMMPDVVGRLEALELRNMQAAQGNRITNNNGSQDLNLNGPWYLSDKLDVRALGIELEQHKINAQRGRGAVYTK